MKTRIFGILILCCYFLVTSCVKGKDDASDEVVIGGNTSGTVNTADIDNSFQCNSKTVSYSNSVVIVFDSSAGTATVTNSMLADGVTTTVKNGYVTVVSTSTSAVNYVVSGTINGGGVKIYSDADFDLILNGTNIVSSDGSAINIQSKKKATVTLLDGTSNRLIDGTTYTSGSEDMKGTLFSEGELYFNGAGSLVTKSNASHAICSDAGISITSGTITVNSSAKDAIHSNDFTKVTGGALVLTASSDCVEAEQGNIDMSGGSIIANAVGQGGKGLKAETDVNLSGGALTVTASGNAYYDSEDKDISSPACIKSNANLKISGSPVIALTATGKAGKGITVDGTITVDGGTLTAKTTGASYAYSSSLNSSAKAIKADGVITINSGTLSVSTATDGAEGIESKSKIFINGGKLEITAYDDCINASSYIEINGGFVFCSASNNDGIDSNGTITINGGTVVSYGATAPEEGIDCDQNTFTITGGTVIGIGGAASTPTSSACKQNALLYGVTASSLSNFLHIEDASGNEVFTFKLSRTYSGTITACITTPNIKTSTTYQIYTGGSVSGGSDFHGMYTGATYTKGTSLTSFTPSSALTTVGSVSTGPGGGGGPGGWGG